MDTRNTSRYWLRVSLAVWAALLLLLLTAAIVRGGESRGGWFSNAFQAVNLDPVPASFEARFVDASGTTVYTFTDTLPPGQGRFYEPAEWDPPLPESFTGTLVLDSENQVAMEIMHFADLGGGGNMLLEGVQTDRLDSFGYVPIDPCVHLYIHNLAETAISAEVRVYDADGQQATSLACDIGPQATYHLYPGGESGFSDFVGTGVVTATGAIEVTVVRACSGAASFVASPVADTVLFAPVVPPRQPGWVTSTLQVQNASPTFTADVAISFCDGSTVTLSLAPLGSAVVPSPFPAPVLWPQFDSWGSATIVASQPVVAYVTMQSRWLTAEGALAYRAIGQSEATPVVALPIVFNGYRGWAAENGLWVQNLGADAATVDIRYIAVPTGTVVIERLLVPILGLVHATVPLGLGATPAVVLVADQPVAAVTAAYNLLPPNGTDHWMLYRGANFGASCLPIVGADFSWQPLRPAAGQLVTFTATAWTSGTGWLGGPLYARSYPPTLPITYTWDLGDGGTAEGEAVGHVYAAPGRYTVTLTATNCGGSGSAVVSRRLLVRCGLPGCELYLPLLMRGG